MSGATLSGKRVSLGEDTGSRTAAAFFRLIDLCLDYREGRMLNGLWSEDSGQDIAEYAVVLAVILVLVVGTIRLVGSNANNAFSAVASSIQ